MFDIDYLSYATQSRALSVKYWAVNEFSFCIFMAEVSGSSACMQTALLIAKR